MGLEEVAKRAKVSMSTVSRVVNEMDNVNAVTRKRVLAALNELHYTPNLQARSLVSGKSKTIGIIVSNLQNPFYVDLFCLLEKYACMGGYELLLANTNYDPERLEQALKMMMGRRVAGLAIAISETLPSVIPEVIAGRIPIVCFDSGEGHQNIHQIHWDRRQGTRLLVEHLHALGHRRMAYIGTQIHLKAAEVRRTVFIETAERLNVEHAEIAVEFHGLEAGSNAVQRLVENGFNASAILCINDITALGVLRELRKRNLSVPQDVSVTGFDNITLSEYSYPPLTTVSISRDNVAQMIFKMLTTNKDANRPINYRIESDVIIRESTGPYCGGGLLTEREPTA